MESSYKSLSKGNETLIKGKAEIEAIKMRIKKKRELMADTTLREYTKGITQSLVAFKTASILKGHLNKIYSLDWCHSMPYLASVSNDGKIIIWNARTSNKIAAIPLKSNWIMTCAYSPSGKYVASGGLDNACTIYEVDYDTKINPTEKSYNSIALRPHKGFVSCCQFIDDDQIFTGSSDHTIALRNIEENKTLSTFSGHEGEVLSLHYHPSKNLLVSGGGDAVAKVWDMRTAKSVHSFREHNGDINVVKFFPDGNGFISGDDDGYIRFFDLRFDGLVNQYSYQNSLRAVISLGFSKSGRLIFCAYEDGVCYVWDTLKAEHVASLTGHLNRVSCLAVSSDGYAVATGSWDKSLRIWTLL